MNTPLHLVCFLLLSCLLPLGPLHASESPKEEQPFSWSDEALANSLLNRPDYLQVSVFYSGQCPSADRMVRQDIKAIHDLIETEQLPVVLILVTPDKEPGELVNFAKDCQMTGALFAKDQKNLFNISLRNIYQTQIFYQNKELRGTVNAATVRDLVTKTGAKHHYPVADLKDPLAKQLWWMVERGQPGAVETLVKAAKRSAISEDAQRILAVVEADFLKQQQALVDAPASINTFEALEILLTDGKGLDLSAASERFKALHKDPALKDEIKARAAYRKIETELLGSTNQKRRQQAPSAFKQLAEHLPDTKYGKLASRKALSPAESKTK